MDELEKLQARLGCNFTDQSLLEQALTHRSRSVRNYERLEFLGDSILGFVVSEWLYHTFPGMAEGKLSRMRSSVVRRETLAEIARNLDLSEALILGAGELKSGGFKRDSILADTLEALIGAVYLDQGLAVVKKIILTHFGPLLAGLDPAAVYKDPKSRLQEYLQKHGYSVPSYEILRVLGEAHDQTFEVICKVEGITQGFVASGSSRRLAEQKAARKAYSALTDKDAPPA